MIIRDAPALSSRLIQQPLHSLHNAVPLSVLHLRPLFAQRSSWRYVHDHVVHSSGVDLPRARAYADISHCYVHLGIRGRHLLHQVSPVGMHVHCAIFTSFVFP